MKPVVPERVEIQLNSVGDWIRFNPWQWFIYSDRSATEIANYARFGLDTGDHVLVLPIGNGMAQGWAPNWVWTWLNSKLAPSGGLGALPIPPQKSKF